jgi:hypothetical protein
MEFAGIQVLPNFLIGCFGRLSRNSQDLTATPGNESVDLRGGRTAAVLDEFWPIRDREISVFLARDAVEYLCDPVNTMREILRCLAPQGWLHPQPPRTDGCGAFRD